MKVKTRYIAPVSLWLVVRKRVLPTGPFVEPAWVGSEEAKGPIIFTSRMLAAVYASLRNKYHRHDDSNNWRVIPLWEFDLLQHVRECDGSLWCMMAFGVTMEDVNSIIVATGAPRMRYVPLQFTPPADAEGVTFSFNQWVFDFIRDEYQSIGFVAFEKAYEHADEMGDASFRQAVKQAIECVHVCRTPTERATAIWGIYSVDSGMWLSDENIPGFQSGQRPTHVLH